MACIDRLGLRSSQDDNRRAAIQEYLALPAGSSESCHSMQQLTHTKCSSLFQNEQMDMIDCQGASGSCTMQAGRHLLTVAVSSSSKHSITSCSRDAAIVGSIREAELMAARPQLEMPPLEYWLVFRKEMILYSGLRSIIS